MANTIEYASIFQTALDSQMVAASTTGWMEANAGQVKYSGGKDIKIPKITMDGLSDYDRSNGFTASAVTSDYETLTMSMDRGAQFTIDENDVDESNFALTASNVMSEFQKTKVIPEVDSYRYSKIASLAITAGNAAGGYTPAAADVYSKLKADIAAVQDKIGDVPLIISMSRGTKAVLESSTEITRQLPVTDFAAGAFQSKFTAIDDCLISAVPSARLKTAYVFGSKGFTVDAAAKTINWIICPVNTPIAVSKTDGIRVFDPQTNQKTRGYLIDLRKYHDLFIPDNKLISVYVNIKEALS